MEGACRHYLKMKSLFRGDEVHAIDSSQTMLDYGRKHYKMKPNHQHCCKVQDFNYQSWLERISLWFCWWNACFLGKEDLKQYLVNMMLTLRCPKEKDEFYKGRAHAGYIILAEPIG